MAKMLFFKKIKHHNTTIPIILGSYYCTGFAEASLSPQRRRDSAMFSHPQKNLQIFYFLVDIA